MGINVYWRRHSLQTSASLGTYRMPMPNGSPGLGTLMMQGNSACVNTSMDNTKHKNAAGNEWREGNVTEPRIDIQVETVSPILFLYWAHQLAEDFTNSTIPFRSSPILINNFAYIKPLCSQKTSTSCDAASKNFTQTAQSNLQAFIMEANAAIANLTAEINSTMQLLNAGNAQSLIDIIHSDLPAGTVKNQLMEASPYLSDRVLVAAISEKPSPLPPGHIKQIVVANSPVTLQVMAAIDNRSDIPNGIRQQIDAAQMGVSERYITESNLNQLQADVFEAESMLANAYLDLGNTADAAAVLEESQMAESKKMLAELYRNTGNIAGSRNALSQMLDWATIENLNEYQNYAALFAILLDLQEANLTVYQISTTQEQLLRTIAATGTSAAAGAEVLLTQVFGEEFLHPVVVVDDSLTRYMNTSGRYTALNSESDNSELFAKIYPNPSNGSFVLNYSLTKETHGKLQIIDITGRLMGSYTLTSDKNLLPLSLKNLTNGMYFYRVYCEEELVTEEKLIIIK